MAYFSNGTEGEVFDAECSDCPLGQEPCLIAWVQMEFNYKASNNKLARKILNCLVKQEKGKYIGCQMKAMVEELANRVPVIEGQMDLFEGDKT